jgi:hypothetical protein
MHEAKKRDRRRNIVTLEDLAPRHDVKGGVARRVFGAEPPAPRVDDAAPQPPRRPKRTDI